MIDFKRRLIMRDLSLDFRIHQFKTKMDDLAVQYKGFSIQPKNMMQMYFWKRRVLASFRAPLGGNPSGHRIKTALPSRYFTRALDFHILNVRCFLLLDWPNSADLARGSHWKHDTSILPSLLAVDPVPPPTSLIFIRTGINGRPIGYTEVCCDILFRFGL